MPEYPRKQKATADEEDEDKNKNKRKGPLVPNVEESSPKGSTFRKVSKKLQ